MRLTVAILFLSSVLFTAKAQYPEIPPEVQASSDADMAKAQVLSDEAWEKALEIVREDARNGKPYISWAAKPSDLPQADIPAFPGAKGGGAYSFGGRGGNVYVVANLNDRGKGSFRWACEQGGARIIVFNVAGVIKLESPVSIRAPYATIVGNTAPGDGVVITGESVWIDTHDVVIRHMKFRRGATNVARRDDALGGNGVGNIMIDHVSASWGLDENISMYRHVYEAEDGQKIKMPTVNITIQNTISSEALDTYNHAFGSTIGGLNCLFYNNLWACNISRNPSIGMYGQFNMVNNVLFNWWNRSVDGGDHHSYFNIVNNYFKPGPITPKGEPIAFRVLKPESGRSKESRDLFGKAYVGGNVTEGYPVVTENNWQGGVQPPTNDIMKVLNDLKVDNPFPLPNLEIKSAEQSYEYVLANAGATLPKRDAVDKRVVEQVRTGEIRWVEGGKVGIGSEYINRRLPEDSYKQGIITHPSQVGGLPAYEGKPYKDKDGDGMPDAWEKKYGLNPKDASDAMGDLNGDGYTNIEMFIYNIDPTKKVDWTDPANNNDTLAY